MILDFCSLPISKSETRLYDPGGGDSISLALKYLLDFSFLSRIISGVANRLPWPKVQVFFSIVEGMS